MRGMDRNRRRYQSHLNAKKGIEMTPAEITTRLYRVEVQVDGPLWNTRRIVTDAGYAAECAEHLKDTEGVAATVTAIEPDEALQLLNDLLDRDARELARLRSEEK